MVGGLAIIAVLVSASHLALAVAAGWFLLGVILQIGRAILGHRTQPSNGEAH